MPARILVLDDDTAITQLVSDTLAREGFEIRSAALPSEALALAKAGTFDLVVTDVNLPEMDGFEFRGRVHTIAGQERTPFIFMSAADATAELSIARNLGSDKLLIKPLKALDLRRAVQVTLGIVRSDRGPIPAALDRILAQIAIDRETGILTAVAGTTVKRVVFQDGNLAFAASNDPREVIGQVFVRSGLISEADLAAALSHRETSGPAPIGAVLTALRKVTPEQCQKVFESKIRESLLDLFLWKGGHVDYAAGGIADAEKPFPMSLSLPPLRIEGLKRRIKWAEVRRLLPDPGVRFERPGNRWPPGFPRTEGDKLLAKHVEAGRSMAEILVELRGQDFAVGARLADLIKNGALKAVEGAGFSGAVAFDSVAVDIDDELAAIEAQETDAGLAIDDGGDDIDDPVDIEPMSGSQKSTRILADPPQAYVEPASVAMLTRALVLFRTGDLLGAREGLVEVLLQDPANPLARQRIEEVDRALSAAAAEEGLRPDVKIKLAVPLENLVGQAIPPNDAFVLTRLAAGALSIGDLVRICPMPQNEVLSVIQRYLASSVLKKV